MAKYDTVWHSLMVMLGSSLWPPAANFLGVSSPFSFPKYAQPSRHALKTYCTNSKMKFCGNLGNQHHLVDPANAEFPCRTWSKKTRGPCLFWLDISDDFFWATRLQIYVFVVHSTCVPQYQWKSSTQTPVQTGPQRLWQLVRWNLSQPGTANIAKLSNLRCLTHRGWLVTCLSKCLGLNVAIC